MSNLIKGCPVVGTWKIEAMERVEKSVFISYRRTNIPWALAIFQDLTYHGYDVFFDYTGIASGDLGRVVPADDSRSVRLILAL
jgi:hypothetical protein